MLLPTGTAGRERYNALATKVIITLNAAIFMLEMLYFNANGEIGFIKLLSNITFNVCNVGTAPLPQMALAGLASMFLHGSLLHVGGNMLFLWVFGRKVEQYFGTVKFLAFYLIAGYMAIFGHMLFGGVVCQTTTDGLLVGASGAVAGIMGAFLFLHPGVNINTIILPGFSFKVPAIFFLIFWFASDFLNGIGWFAADGDPVAHWAHIGGFIFGFAVVFIMTMFWKPAPKPDPFAYLDE
jgi:rhomboid family protein